MPRILAIDYGIKRTGLAVSDPLQMIAGGLTTIASASLIPFLREYFKKEEVEMILIGDPRNLDNTATHGTLPVQTIIEKLKREFPALPIKKIDERFTSKMASHAIIGMGLKKKDRRDKALVDEIAATILLQGWLDGVG